MTQRQDNPQSEVDLDTQINRRLTRSGWAIMLWVLCALFIVIYLFVNLFQVPMSKRNSQLNALSERVEQLEQQISTLESQLGSEKQ